MFKREKMTKEASKFQNLEIERKFKYKGSQWESFVKLCRSLNPVDELEVTGPDTYYANPEKSVFLRWRHSQDLNELTIKERHSSSSTLIRKELDLDVTKNHPKTLLSFIKSLGFSKLFRIRKTCHIFWVEDTQGVVSIVIYKVVCKGRKDRVFVEIEPDKGLSIANAKFLIRKYEKLLFLAPHQRINNSLLELYSGENTPLVDKTSSITCISCGEIKSIKEFYPSWVLKTGSKCADCCAKSNLTEAAADVRNVNLQKRRKEDVNFRLKERLRSRLNFAIKSKKGSAVADLGCTISEFKTYIEQRFYESPEHGKMTWQNWGVGKGKWQLDHIIPLFSLNLEDRFDFLKAVHYSNIRPLWFEDHVEKTRNDKKEK